ncbi:MAG: hypothetical protein ACTSXV_01900, partial [Alphaproteobacteria bacterium]
MAEFNSTKYKELRKNFFEKIQKSVNIKNKAQMIFLIATADEYIDENDFGSALRIYNIIMEKKEIKDSDIKTLAM